jgi:hypothetical protein
MTFHDLERRTSSTWKAEDHPSSLTDWYISIRDTPLDTLSVEDLCRAVRQEIFVVLPFAVALLEQDVLTGYKYDGELIAALAGLNEKYWRKESSVTYAIKHVLSRDNDFPNDAELLRDVSTLQERLGKVG